MGFRQAPARDRGVFRSNLGTRGFPDLKTTTARVDVLATLASVCLPFGCALFIFSPVGFKGNRSLLDIFSFLPWVLSKWRLL